MSLAESRVALAGAQGQQLVSASLAFEQGQLCQAAAEGLEAGVPSVELVELRPGKYEQLAFLEGLDAQIRGAARQNSK